jgi:hypothetical protein
MHKQKNLKADQWELIEFPAILPSEKPIWPEYWDIDSLTATRASLTEQKWQAQWQQNPTSEEGSIIKREWWQTWDEDEVPDLIHVIQSYDTAFSKKETADYSVLLQHGAYFRIRNEVIRKLYYLMQKEEDGSLQN